MLKLFKRKSRKDFEGLVSGDKFGHGFFAPDGMHEEWFIPSDEMSRVLDGDRVVAVPTGEQRRGKKKEARIVKILSRSRETIVGKYKFRNGKPAVVPESEKVSRLMFPEKSVPGVHPGDLVSVRLVSKRNLELSDPLRCRIEKVLGSAKKAQTETDIALAEFSLQCDFSKSALKAAEKLPDEVDPKFHKDRKDLTSVPFVTIDGEDARDYDDAVYCRKDNNGWSLFVAIADVSHYVRPNDPLDRVAQERTSSVYFPDRVVPMLPEKLSNGLCSLVPKKPRLALVCEMQIDKNGQCREIEICPAVIISRARLTYDRVAEYLGYGNTPAKKGTTLSEQPAICVSLRSLQGLTKLLLKTRKARSALEFHHLEQVRITLADNGEVRDLGVEKRNFASLMIEEAMLIANVAVAEFLSRQNMLPFCYRVLEEPEEENVDELRLFLRYYKIKIPFGKVTPEIYGKILEQVHSYPEAAVLERKILLSFRKACYARKNVGHFGLNYEKYTHFTSPIRRYPDLLVHRAIKSVLFAKQAKQAPAEYPYMVTDIDRLAARCSEMERTVKRRFGKCMMLVNAVTWQTRKNKNIGGLWCI